MIKTYNRMIDKLITVKGFKDLLEDKYPLQRGVKYNLISKYIDFLEKPLTLDMFVPCLDGVPLEEPMILDQKDPYVEAIHAKQNLKLWNQYQQAESKVLFKEFYWDGAIYHNDALFLTGNFAKEDTIADLQNHWSDIELTESAKNQIK